jgi:hypothetical protein
MTKQLPRRWCFRRDFALQLSGSAFLQYAGRVSDRRQYSEFMPSPGSFRGWKGSGVDGKGGLGSYTIPRYLREQSITIMHRA